MKMFQEERKMGGNGGDGGEMGHVQATSTFFQVPFFERADKSFLRDPSQKSSLQVSSVQNGKISRSSEVSGNPET